MSALFLPLLLFDGHLLVGLWQRDGALRVLALLCIVYLFVCFKLETQK